MTFKDEVYSAVLSMKRDGHLFCGTMFTWGMLSRYLGGKARITVTNALAKLAKEGKVGILSRKDKWTTLTYFVPNSKN